MRNRLLVVVLVVQLVLSPLAFAGWETIERDGKKFAFVPSDKIIELALDMKLLDKTNTENDDLKNLNYIQAEQIESLRFMMQIQSQATELYKVKEGIYTNQVNYLTETIEAEFKENERLRLSKPNPLYWSAFGGIVTIGVISFSVWVLENIK